MQGWWKQGLRNPCECLVFLQSGQHVLGRALNVFFAAKSECQTPDYHIRRLSRPLVWIPKKDTSALFGVILFVAVL